MLVRFVAAADVRDNKVQQFEDVEWWLILRHHATVQHAVTVDLFLRSLAVDYEAVVVRKSCTNMFWGRAGTQAGNPHVQVSTPKISLVIFVHRQLACRSAGS